MRVIAVVSLLLLTACGSSSSALVLRSASPSSTRTAAASASPSAATSPSPSPSSSPFTITLPPISPAPIAPAGQCYLPIYWSPGVYASTDAGFLAYPGGNVEGSTPVLADPAQAAYFRPVATYDRAVGRWLPVGPASVAPDGLSFAYAEYDLPNQTMSTAQQRLPMAGASETVWFWPR